MNYAANKYTTLLYLFTTSSMSKPETLRKWELPTVVTDLQMAFPATVKELMPEYQDIPDDFKHMSNPWVQVFSRWFFSGVKKELFVAKPGIDREQALRHINTIIGSFEPKHEHKEAAVAYLMAQWFEPITPKDL